MITLISEIAEMISNGIDREAIKERSRILVNEIQGPEEAKIPSPKSRKGFGYFSDVEVELANMSYADDLSYHNIAKLIGLAYDYLEGR